MTIIFSLYKMPSNSNLQSQYPLSPRKFWKKMIEKTFLWIILLFFASISIWGLVNVYSWLNLSSPIGIFLAFGLAIFTLILIMVLYAWYVKAYIRRYYYDGSDSYVTIKKGVFAPAEIHVQYSKIQDVYVDQDILDRVMGLYDVHLASATAASGIEAHIDGVEQAAAEGLKNFLLQKLQNGDSSSGASPLSTAPDVSPVQPISFSNEISSRTYPITGAWYVQQMFIWFFSSLLISGLISLRIGLGSQASWIAFLVLFAVIYTFHIVYMVLWRSTYSFSFLPDYIVTKKGIIAKNENHLPYRSVQDVTVSQGIIERFLGIATVRIENAAAAQMVGRTMVSSAVLIPGQPLVRANEISDAIKKVALTRSSTQTGL